MQGDGTISLRLWAGAAARLLCLAAAVCPGCSDRRGAPRTSRSGGAGGSSRRETMASITKRLGPDATVEQIALEAGRLKVASAARPLMNALAKADPNTRAACLWALGEIGDREAVIVARFYLRDKSPRVRKAAADALAKLGDESAVAGLLAEGVRDKDPAIRLHAYACLAKIGTDEAVKGLMGAFVDESPAVRAAAAEHVLRLGDVGMRHVGVAVGLICARPLTAEERPLYDNLASVLTRVGGPVAIAHWVRLIARTDPAAYSRDRPDAAACQALRRRAIDAVVALGPEAVKPLADAAIYGFGRRSLYLKRAAGEAFVRLGPAATGPIAAKVLSRETAHDMEELKLWADVLERIGDPNGEAALAKAQRLIRGERPPPPPDLGPNPAYVNGLPGGVTASLSAPPRPWHDVHVVLRGALPNPNPNLGHDEELYLARIADPAGQAKWRPYVMGYSAFFRRGKRLSNFNWMDHEGTLLEASEDADTIRLKVALELNDGPWVAGGRLSAEMTLGRKRADDGDWLKGEVLAGTYKGVFDKRACSTSGPRSRSQVAGNADGFIMRRPWPSPVPGWKPPAADEHPRLIFRRSDLPELRRRAATPTGKLILARLRAILERKGHWTLWHAMGYGLLWQLTGERRHAELAREHTDFAINGTRTNDDGRYSFAAPGGKLRAGSSYAAVAMAYDLCYDGWDDAYRRKVAKAVEQKVWGGGSGGYTQAEPSNPGLVFRTEGGQHSPLSNHFGAWNGGGGTAVLGILGDSGVDPVAMTRAHHVFLRRAKRALIDGYGDAAWFWEGHHCGRLSSNTGLVSYLQALRVGAGLDYVANWPGAQCLLTKWLYEINRQDGKLANMQRGMYHSPVFGRGGMSSGGDFAQGFGIVPEAQKPAVLWFYNHVIDPRPPAEQDYDAINYPHRAVYAFVNWPIGPDGSPVERNPSEVMPTGLIDRRYSYGHFGGWDTKEGTIAVQAFGSTGILGLGVNTGFAGSIPPNGDIHTVREYPEHACVVSFTYDDFEGRSAGSLAADFSGRCGAPLLMAYANVKLDKNGRPLTPRPGGAGDVPEELAGALKKAMEDAPDANAGTDAPARMRSTTVRLHGWDVVVGTLQRGRPPPAGGVGDGAARRIVVGRRRIDFDGRELKLE